MEVKVLSNQKGMAVLGISVPAPVLSAAIDEAYAVYEKNHDKPEFTRAEVSTSQQGQTLLHQAVEDVFSDIYNEVIRESGLTVASQPQITVLQADELAGLEFQMKFAVRPELKIGQYKGIHVKCPDFNLTEDEGNAALAQAEANHTSAQSIDRPAESGDTAVIDFTGYLDGEPFEGGAGKSYPLVLGSGTFIPGFEDQLIGASAGDEVDVNVTFPENYGAPNLAGKAVVFKCAVKSVQTMVKTPLSEEEKKQVLQQAADQKKNLADQEIENEVLTKILDEAQVEIPEAMLESEAEICMQQFAAEVQNQGMDLGTYSQRLGKSIEEMTAEMQPLARRRIMLRLVLEAITEAEGITATQEELDARWDSMAKQYGITANQLKAYYGENADAEMAKEITSAKAYALLRDCTILDRE